MTVTGTGNFTGTQTAQFTIACLICGNIVFGGTPSSSATAAFGTPSYSYSNQQDGPRGVEYL